MADTTIKLSGTYDSIEAYELLEEMRGVASDYLPLTGGEISGDLIVDGQLSANLTGNVTGTASGNLPLSGGTMTGGITTSSTDFIVKANNTNHLTIMGGTAYGSSASIRLAGGEETGQTGLFQLRSQDGVNSKDLIGKPSGEFTWGGSTVAVMGTLQNGHGILTGRVSSITVNANSYKQDTVSFGQTFASAPHVIVCCAYGHAFVEAGVRSITTTGFGYTVSNQNNSTYSNEAIEWIAIG